MTTPVATDSINWRAGAEALARAVPLEDCDAEAVAVLSEETGKSTRVAVACSGGADSLAVLLLAWAHFPELRGRISILNFNHKTRLECVGESRFVQAVAEALGEAFVGGETREDIEGASEADLRRCRLAFFNDTLSALHCRVLVQGHQADDVAETLLMRLARGSGTGGLAAPRPVQRFSDGRMFVRPLLAVTKAVLVDALRVAGLPWCDDASNDTDAYLRNRIRHTVIPAWESAQGTPVSLGVLRARRLLAEDDAALEAWLDVLWARVAYPNAEENKFDWTPLTGLPVALHRRALWRVLSAVALSTDVNAAAIDVLVAALALGRAGRWSIGKGWVSFDGRNLRVVCGEQTTPLQGSGLLMPGVSLFWPTGDVLRAEAMPVSSVLFAEIGAGGFSPDETIFINPDGLASGGLRVRFWEQGDAYRPLGAPGLRKLSDIFVDKKVPAQERHRRPVVCDKSGIVWVPGLPPAERCRLPGPIDMALRLTWLRSPINFSVL